MTEYSVYDNPLVGRYASAEMAQLWGPERKFRTWRRLWIALAEAQAELGLTTADGATPRIRPEQLEELRATRKRSISTGQKNMNAGFTTT